MPRFDAAGAAKTTGNDSPLQPNSGTMGRTSFTCKEGGDREVAESEDPDGSASGNRLKEQEEPGASKTDLA